jgi:hypothetical protein
MTIPEILLVTKVGNLDRLKQLHADGQSMEEEYPEWGGAPLHYAAAYGRDEVVWWLCVDVGVNINMPNKQGDTPLHCACRNGHTQVVNVLLVFGARIDLQNSFGFTPQQEAEREGHPKVAKLLNRDDYDIQGGQPPPPPQPPPQPAAPANQKWLVTLNGDMALRWLKMKGYISRDPATDDYRKVAAWSTRMSPPDAPLKGYVVRAAYKDEKREVDPDPFILVLINQQEWDQLMADPATGSDELQTSEISSEVVKLLESAQDQAAQQEYLANLPVNRLKDLRQTVEKAIRLLENTKSSEWTGEKQEQLKAFRDSLNRVRFELLHRGPR